MVKAYNLFLKAIHVKHIKLLVNSNVQKQPAQYMNKKKHNICWHKKKLVAFAHKIALQSKTFDTKLDSKHLFCLKPHEQHQTAKQICTILHELYTNDYGITIQKKLKFRNQNCYRQTNSSEFS